MSGNTVLDCVRVDSFTLNNIFEVNPYSILANRIGQNSGCNDARTPEQAVELFDRYVEVVWVDLFGKWLQLMLREDA